MKIKNCSEHFQQKYLSGLLPSHLKKVSEGKEGQKEGGEEKMEGKRRGREGGSFTCSWLRALAHWGTAAAPQEGPTRQRSGGIQPENWPQLTSPSDSASAPLYTQWGPLRLFVHWQILFTGAEHRPGDAGCCPLPAGPPRQVSISGFVGLFCVPVLVQVPAQYYPTPPETPDIPTSKLPCEARTGVSCIIRDTPVGAEGQHLTQQAWTFERSAFQNQLSRLWNVFIT